MDTGETTAAEIDDQPVAYIEAITAYVAAEDRCTEAMADRDFAKDRLESAQAEYTSAELAYEDARARLARRQAICAGWEAEVLEADDAFFKTEEVLEEVQKAWAQSNPVQYARHRGLHKTDPALYAKLEAGAMLPETSTSMSRSDLVAALVEAS